MKGTKGLFRSGAIASSMLLMIALSLMVLAGCDPDGGGGNEDTTAPTVVSAAINNSNNSNTGSLVITFSEPVTGTPDKADFTLSGMAADPPIWAVYDPDGATIQFTLNNGKAYVVDTAIKLSYTPGATQIKDAAGNALASFTDQAVTHDATLENTRWEKSGGYNLRFHSDGEFSYYTGTTVNALRMYWGTYSGSLPSLALTITNRNQGGSLPTPATGTTTLSGTTLTVSGFGSEADLIGGFVLDVD